MIVPKAQSRFSAHRGFKSILQPGFLPLTSMPHSLISPPPPRARQWRKEEGHRCVQNSVSSVRESWPRMKQQLRKVSKAVTGSLYFVHQEPLEGLEPGRGLGRAAWRTGHDFQGRAWRQKDGSRGDCSYPERNKGSPSRSHGDERGGRIQGSCIRR